MGVLDIIDYLMMFAVMLPVGSVIAFTILGGNDLYLAVFMVILRREYEMDDRAFRVTWSDGGIGEGLEKTNCTCAKAAPSSAFLIRYSPTPRHNPLQLSELSGEI